MTLFRVRPWFLPSSLAALLTEVWPDGPADAPSDADAGGRSAAGSGAPPDTRSGECGPADPRPATDTATGAGERPEQPADRR
ncbi:hypothetical protein AB0C96_22335 [Streptomyces sp. NPDC048506]|uniref:hypothetical protein n=1 Tax=Streptomyces sp. NPDC048506 TaxID=3155028 RepID=UPI0034165F4B